VDKQTDRETEGAEHPTTPTDIVGMGNNAFQVKVYCIHYN